MKKTVKKSKNKPVISFKDYPVQISIWKRDAKVDKKTVTFYDSTITSTYKDDNDEYQTSSNFSEQNLLKTALLCQKAYNWIINAKQKDFENKKEDDDTDEDDEETDEDDE